MFQPILGALGITISITSLLVWVIYLLIVALWCIFTMIIRYHWKNYGSGKIAILTMNFVYLLGSALLLGIMTIFAILFTST